jgi:hypothetical protein
MTKKSKNKITQRTILKYNLCEHHQVGYKELEKGFKLQDKVVRRLARDIERKGARIEYLENQKEFWVADINKRLLARVENQDKELNDLREYYEKELKELNALYDNAIEHNKQMAEVNKQNLETNKDLLKAHNEITRAYNGLHHMGKFAEEIGVDIKEHNKMLPENNEYEGFEQKHTLLESGKVRHQWSIKKKKKDTSND